MTVDYLELCAKARDMGPLDSTYREMQSPTKSRAQHGCQRAAVQMHVIVAFRTEAGWGLCVWLRGLGTPANQAVS